MLDPDDRTLLSRRTSPPAKVTRTGRARSRPEPRYDAGVRLVGHRVSEDPDGELHVEVEIACEGRVFTGKASGTSILPDRLRVPALATLRALDSCLQVFYLGASHPALVLDRVAETSVGDFPVAVVMITASEKVSSTPVVASCPLVGMSDLAIVLATLQATTRIVGHWLAWGDRTLPSGDQDRPQ